MTKLKYKKYYVMAHYSHTDEQQLWRVVSRAIRLKQDAQSFARCSQESESKHDHFVVSKTDEATKQDMRFNIMFPDGFNEDLSVNDELLKKMSMDDMEERLLSHRDYYGINDKLVGNSV